MIKWKDLECRKGIFCINADFMKKHPDDVMAVMVLCVIVRAEHRFWDNQIEYQAYSLEFDVVPEGDAVPEYIWEMRHGYAEAERLETEPSFSNRAISRNHNEISAMARGMLKERHISPDGWHWRIYCFARAMEGETDKEELRRCLNLFIDESIGGTADG